MSTQINKNSQKHISGFIAGRRVKFLLLKIQRYQTEFLCQKKIAASNKHHNFTFTILYNHNSHIRVTNSNNYTGPVH